MGQFIKTNRPDRPVPGEALMRGSVAGRKTQFVNDTGIASASFTLAAGERIPITVNLAVWPNDLPLDARTTGNLVTWDDCVSWGYEEIYVDVDSPDNYVGNYTLSADQQLVEVQKMEQMNPELLIGSVPNTSTARYIVKNGGALSHTIYVYFQCKFIMYGDQTL